MKNFKVVDKETGKEYWISRSSAVVGIVYSKVPKNLISKILSIKSFKEFFEVLKNGFKDEYVFLISKRGPGCPDFIGSWAFTCGYLDWDETKKDAVIRELWEELGLSKNIIKSITKFCEIDDPEKDSRQNLVTRYLIEVDFRDLYNNYVFNNRDNKLLDSSFRGGEKREVEEIRVISKYELQDYSDWAFNHDTVLREVIDYLKTGRKPYYCND